MTRYFELLKDTMKTFVNLQTFYGPKANSTIQLLIARQMVNSPQMRELYVLQYRFISDSLRFLVNRLTEVTNEEF
jgi:hypothetical protein